MNTDLQNKVLSYARSFIDTPHSVLDCSNAVYNAYKLANMSYAYKASWQIKPTSPPENFTWIGKDLPPSKMEPGDMIVFANHMGIWDPAGCETLGTNAVCKSLKNKAPLLSSRGNDEKDPKTGKFINDRGEDYGQLEWWGRYDVYRWSK